MTSNYMYSYYIKLSLVNGVDKFESRQIRLIQTRYFQRYHTILISWLPSSLGCHLLPRSVSKPNIPTTERPYVTPAMYNPYLMPLRLMVHVSNICSVVRTGVLSHIV